MALQSDPIITEKDILENVNQQKKAYFVEINELQEKIKQNKSRFNQELKRSQTELNNLIERIDEMYVIQKKHLKALREDEKSQGIIDAKVNDLHQKMYDQLNAENAKLKTEIEVARDNIFKSAQAKEECIQENFKFKLQIQKLEDSIQGESAQFDSHLREIEIALGMHQHQVKNGNDDKDTRQ